MFLSWQIIAVELKCRSGFISKCLWSNLLLIIGEMVSKGNFTLWLGPQLDSKSGVVTVDKSNSLCKAVFPCTAGGVTNLPSNCAYTYLQIIAMVKLMNFLVSHALLSIIAMIAKTLVFA